MPDQHDLRERALSNEVRAQMAEIFMWAVSTGPGHPDATPEKAIDQLLKPVKAALAMKGEGER